MQKKLATGIFLTAAGFLFGALKSNPVLAPSITIPTVDGSYIEGVGLCFDVRITDPLNTPTTVDIMIDPTTSATLTQTLPTHPRPLNFPPGLPEICLFGRAGQVEPFRTS